MKNDSAFKASTVHCETENNIVINSSNLSQIKESPSS